MTPMQTTEADLDLALAAALQAALLPAECPSDCPHLAVAARNRMCGSVGGDFYDFIRLHDDQIAVAIGDVVGHGVQAALVMAQIMGRLRSNSPSRSRPAEFVAELNRMLIDLGERTNMVVSCTMLYGVLDAPTGTGFFINAGHPHPHVCDTRSCEILPPPGHDMLLGVEEFEPTEFCLNFQPGQRLILHTDGVEDAADGTGRRFGQARLHEAISHHAAGSREDVADAVFRAVDEFRGDADQTDDETIVVIDRM